MIDKTILDKFIELGKNDHLDSPEYTRKIKDLKEYDFINIIGPNECSKIIIDFSVDDLYFLIRAIVIAERENKWSGGSVASSIWLFIELQKLDYLKSIELANWILPRTNNYYVPFGFNNHNAKNYNEFIEICKTRNEQFERSEEYKNKQEANANQERQNRRIQKELSNRNRKSDYRKELIEKLNKMQILEQIKQLAQDEEYAISFYPTSIVTRATDEVISRIDKETIIKLMTKLKGRQKGSWAKLKRKLTEIHFKDKALPWNRKPWHEY